MAHFAKIENSTVMQVIVVSNDSIKDLPFPDSESVGQAFIKSLGIEGIWIQTSYNAKFRKNFAGLGYVYDKNLDAFIPPKPYESWVLDEEKGLWSAPFPYPDNNKDYYWNEDIKEWKESNLKNL